MELRKHITTLFVLVVLLMTSLGCNLSERLRSTSNSGSNGRTANDPATPYTPNGKSGEMLYANADELNAFLDKLKEAVGTDDPKFLDLLVYNEYAMAKVQDPKKPENIDGYTWRNGQLSGPQPVKIYGDGKIEDNVFSLSSVNVAALPALTDEITEKMKDVEGAHLIGYSIKRNLPFNKDIEIHPLTDATRKSIYAEADAKGKLTKFEVK